MAEYVPNSVADRTYRKAVHAAITWIEKNVPEAVYEALGLSDYSEPPAIPVDKVLALSKATGYPVTELVDNGIGMLRMTVLEYMTAKIEERVLT